MNFLLYVISYMPPKRSAAVVQSGQFNAGELNLHITSHGGCRKSYCLQTFENVEKQDFHLLSNAAFLYTTCKEGKKSLVYTNPFTDKKMVAAIPTERYLIAVNSKFILLVTFGIKTVELAVYDLSLELVGCRTLENSTTYYFVDTHITTYDEKFYLLAAIKGSTGIMEISAGSDVDIRSYWDGVIVEDLRTGAVAVNDVCTETDSRYVVSYVKIHDSNLYVSGKKLYLFDGKDLEYLPEYRVVRAVKGGCYVVEKQDLLFLSNNATIVVAKTVFSGAGDVYYA